MERRADEFVEVDADRSRLSVRVVSMLQRHRIPQVRCRVVADTGCADTKNHGRPLCVDSVEIGSFDFSND